MNKAIKIALPCAVILFFIGSSMAVGASAPATGVNLTGKDVVFFNTSKMLPLQNEVRTIIQGQKNASGICKFNIQLHKGANEKVVKVVRELAYDPTTCQQLVAQGTLNVGQEYHPNQTTRTIKTSKSTATAGADPTTQATFQTTWYDPVGLAVNSLSDSVNWNYDGSTVSPNGVDWYWDDPWYLTLTGWYMPCCHEEYPYSDSTLVQDSSNAYMEDDSFCAFQTTNVWYHPNYVQGLADGTSYGGVTTWDGGACSTWLWYESQLY